MTLKVNVANVELIIYQIIFITSIKSCVLFDL